MVLHNFCINERLERLGVRVGLGVGMEEDEGEASTFHPREHAGMQRDKETRSAGGGYKGYNKSCAPKFPVLNADGGPVKLLTGDELPDDTRRLIGAELDAHKRAQELRNDQALIIEQRGWKRPALAPKHGRD